MELTDQQASDLQTASLDLMQTAINTVGVAPTIQLLQTITGLILQRPDFARKLANPVIQVRLMALAAKYEGTKPGLFDYPGMMSEAIKIFG
ncbi:hypothetical protein [Fibrella aquatilis]|uniref:Uncharacterized protein n=1 Tax=Fibrella aquatilis TaxID=2817059 RepID=A0A939K0V9_9BACT|nr:hypothetical protein [Fibrella aquatilis]MBO0934599.1 hypothetical protein [Fibrella aquatilis]